MQVFAFLIIKNAQVVIFFGQPHSKVTNSKSSALLTHSSVRMFSKVVFYENNTRPRHRVAQEKLPEK